MTRSTHTLDAQYSLGRQAHEAGYRAEQCPLPMGVKRSWWLAGHHDADMESGRQQFFDDMRQAI